jgi:hypothetical protein
MPEYGGSWECEVPAAPGNVTVALSAAVAADLEQSSTDLKEIVHA